MKKNNSGFMLAELVIVSAIVIGTMVALYTGFNSSYINYKERSKYYSIDCLYAGQTIKNLLIDEFKLTALINNTSSYQDINTYCQSIGENTAFNQYCQEVYSRYNIQKMYLIKYNQDNINFLINNQEFIKNDIALEKYLKVLSKGSGTQSNIYHIIIKDNKDYFADLEVVQ